MPEGTSTDGRPVRLLPITMPGPAALRPGDWHGRGLCVGEDPGVFFPFHGDPGTKAREICDVCPVRGDCLKDATEADEFGIWGGLDQRERRNLKRKQRRRMATSRARDGGVDQAEVAV
jgi:WhiB family redox-sensing transcriptional regulator